MVFWLSPETGGTLGYWRKESDFVCTDNIAAFKKNDKFTSSLAGLESALQGPAGSSACIDGSIYKTPTFSAFQSSAPPAKKRKQEAEGGTTLKASDSQPPIYVNSYPTDDSTIAGLKAHAVDSAVGACHISLFSEADWEKALGTARTKIAAALVDKVQYDLKSVELNLHRLQIVGDKGLDWQVEAGPKGHVATLLVILPIKHKGGKIRVQREEESWTIEPSKRKSFERCSWISFGVEAEFQVEPVTVGTQIVFVYHAVAQLLKAKGTKAGKAKEGKETELIRLLDQVVSSTPKDHPKRIGLLLNQKYTQKDFGAEALKGKDRWLFNVINESKYEVKLTFVRALICSWGFFDEKSYPNSAKRVQMKDTSDEFTDSEMWEVDLTKEEQWRHMFDKANRCRRLPWEMPWLGAKSLFAALAKMTRVDRNAKPSWSEGLTLAETYRAPALLVTVKAGFKDEDDGPFTHFYPVMHPEPRGISSRQDMDWARPDQFYVLADECPERLKEMEQEFYKKKEWVYPEFCGSG